MKDLSQKGGDQNKQKKGNNNNNKRKPHNKKQTKKQDLSDPFPNTFFVQNYLLWNHHQMTCCHLAEAQPASKVSPPAERKFAFPHLRVSSLLLDILKELNNTNQVS